MEAEQKIPEAPTAIEHPYRSLEWIIADLRNELARSEEPVPAGADFHERNYYRMGRLIATVRSTAEMLEAIRKNQPDIPEPRGAKVAVEVLVPSSHIEVQGDVSPVEDSDEHHGTPCIRRAVEAEVSHADILDSAMPNGWEINELDLDQEELKSLLLERQG